MQLIAVGEYQPHQFGERERDLRYACRAKYIDVAERHCPWTKLDGVVDAIDRVVCKDE
jgi:hypothetical protein